MTHFEGQKGILILDIKLRTISSSFGEIGIYTLK